MQAKNGQCKIFPMRMSHRGPVTLKATDLTRCAGVQIMTPACDKVTALSF